MINHIVYYLLSFFGAILESVFLFQNIFEKNSIKNKKWYIMLLASLAVASNFFKNVFPYFFILLLFLIIVKNKNNKINIIMTILELAVKYLIMIVIQISVFIYLDNNNLSYLVICLILFFSIYFETLIKIEQKKDEIANKTLMVILITLCFVNQYFVLNWR